MLYEFELYRSVAEASKNIRCVESEGAVDHSTDQISLGLQEPRRSGRSKGVDSEVVLRAIEADRMSFR